MASKAKYHHLLSRLLRKNISISQLVGYALAALAGMTILFSAFCFREDVKPLFSSDSKLFKPGFMVLNKRVSVLSAFSKSTSIFKPSEIEEIKKQDFVRSVSCFTPSRYQVRATMSLSGQMSTMSTEMFFESVPDRLLLQESNEKWKWDESTRLIPIIIPRDYLNLYNFGFSGSQGLPQISESIIQKLVFQVDLYGSGIHEQFKGQIVGFSDNLNTILVPEAFMEWSNTRFAPQDKDAQKISRLIVEAKNPADPKIAEFFAKKADYEINDSKGENGKLSYFLTILIVALLVVGSLVMLPAIGLMLLSINLMVYKDTQTLLDLKLLGFSWKFLIRPYSILVIILNFLVAILSLILTFIVRGVYLSPLKVLGINETSASYTSTILFSICFVLVLIAFDVLWICRKIKKI